MLERHEEKSARHLQKISTALGSGTRTHVEKLLHSLSSAEIGELLESLPLPKRLAVWAVVEAEFEGDVLVHVNDEVRASLIEYMSQQELVAAAGELELDDLADILDDLPDTVIREVLQAMDRQDRERLAQVLSHHEDSAGGLMNPDVVTVRPDVSLDVVLRYLRLRGELPEMIDQLFVVDRRGGYLGSVKLTDLLIKSPDSIVTDIMSTEVTAMQAELPASEVVQEFEHHDLVSAPVVDEKNMLVGCITIDDVVDVIRDEAEHSVLTMAGLDEEDDMFAPVAATAKRRWVWLSVNLVTAFIAALVLSFFEPTLEQIVALAILFPVVMSMGGIAGTQTLTLVIRGMATGQVSYSNAVAIFRKEVAVGILNGILFAVVVAAIAAWWYADIKLGAVMAAAMLINLIAGAIAGALIPLTLKRINIDPALAGGVVLTTVTDVVGILAFVGLASVVLAQ